MKKYHVSEILRICFTALIIHLSFMALVQIFMEKYFSVNWTNMLLGKQSASIFFKVNIQFFEQLALKSKRFTGLLYNKVKAV